MLVPPVSHRFWRSVVSVKCRGKFGTAFLIQKNGRSGLFLTALHNVLSEKGRLQSARLSREYFRSFSAKVIDFNSARDVALLAADIPALPRNAPASAAIRTAAVYLGRPSRNLQVLQMLDPDAGIVAPIIVAAPSIGETAIMYEIGGKPHLIQNVLSQQGLNIPGGVSGAPVFSEDDGAIVAIACAGADPLAQSFFVPLWSVLTNQDDDGKQISQTVSAAQSETTRLGLSLNYGGVSVLSWIQTRLAIRSLADSGVYDPKFTIARKSLVQSLSLFLQSDSNIAVIAGTSGVGKSSSIAHILRRKTLGRSLLLIRASQIELTKDPLIGTLNGALRIRTFENVPAYSGNGTSGSGPLLVIDGINEFPTENWDHFTKNTLVPFAAKMSRRGWKLLLVTRQDRLDDLAELARSVTLFDPNTALGLDRTSPFPFIAIEGFNRKEFESLISLHGLPPNLPFADLRHPIVFRLMVEAHKGKKIAQVRIRTLLSSYIAEVIRRIHLRCPARNRDRILTLIHEWTESDRVTKGQIPATLLNGADDEQLAEAAVSEGLFERVPGGYRYVYDEIFDFVVSAKIARLIKERCGVEHFSFVEMLHGLGASGITAGAVARSLELLSDESPETASSLATKLVQELQSMRPWVPNIASTGSIRQLFPLIRVLAATEKGAPFDLVKDALPLFDEPDADLKTAWNIQFNVSYALSDDHISYAFDEDRIWRMVRLAAVAERSYPFRSKDVGEQDGTAAAERQITLLSQYKVVRHFVTVFPDQALTCLVNGLDDHDRIGSEHSFGSFCAQIIFVFLAKFDFDRVVSALANSRSVEVIGLFLKITEAFPKQVLERITNGDLLNAPLLTSRSLGTIAGINPALSARVNSLALRMISEHKHSAFLYAGFFSDFASEGYGAHVVAAVLRDWIDGDGEAHELVRCVTSGLIPLAKVLELLTPRLNTRSEEKNRLGFYVSAFDSYLRNISDSEKRLDIIDEIIRVYWATAAAKTREQLFALEVLLGFSSRSGNIRNSVLFLVEKICKEFPDEIGSTLKYFIRGNAATLDEAKRERLFPPIFSNASFAAIFEIIDCSLADDKPQPAVWNDLVSRAITRFGSKAVFDRVVDQIRTCQRMDFLLEPETDRLIKILSELDPQTLDSYRAIFDEAPESILDEMRKMLASLRDE
jgi:hypothetical protein